MVNRQRKAKYWSNKRRLSRRQDSPDVSLAHDKQGVAARLRNFASRSGEFCVCKFIVSTNAEQIDAIHTWIITEPVTSFSKFSGGGDWGRNQTTPPQLFLRAATTNFTTFACWHQQNGRWMGLGERKNSKLVSWSRLWNFDGRVACDINVKGSRTAQKVRPNFHFGHPLVPSNGTGSSSEMCRYSLSHVITVIYYSGKSLLSRSGIKHKIGR